MIYNYFYFYSETIPFCSLTLKKVSSSNWINCIHIDLIGVLLLTQPIQLQCFFKNTVDVLTSLIKLYYLIPLFYQYYVMDQKYWDFTKQLI